MKGRIHKEDSSRSLDNKVYLEKHRMGGKYLRPETMLFCASKFQGYLNEKNHQAKA